jgi:signal transduction histidine kinase
MNGAMKNKKRKKKLAHLNKKDKLTLLYAENIISSSYILESAAKLLNFTVADMLSLAQINSNKFRKNCTVVNIKKVVEEVVHIQKDKADHKEIKFSVKYVGFKNNYFVCTDENRL